MSVTRRELLQNAAAASCGLMLGSLAGGADRAKTPATSMGLASNVFDIRRAAQSAAGGGKMPAAISDPLGFLQECRRFGAGGIQGPLGVRDAAYTSALRRFADEHGLYIEASIMVPQTDAAIERFDNEMKTAKAAGVQVARTVCFPGRRYETFAAADEFARASQRALDALRRAAPIAQRHQVRLAVENHKDQRIAERLDLLKTLGSEYVGTCVDVGNSFALCEDPLQTVRAFAPLAWTVHLKDQALAEYEQGFLFADAAMGDGFLDLPAIVATLRQANPQIRFNLEVITRDPLKVPVFTPQYWSSMPAVPASDLARTMLAVKTRGSARPLPRVTALPVDQRIALENQNIASSIAYAREKLRL